MKPKVQADLHIADVPFATISTLRDLQLVPDTFRYVRLESGHECQKSSTGTCYCHVIKHIKWNDRKFSFEYYISYSVSSKLRFPGEELHPFKLANARSGKLHSVAVDAIRIGQFNAAARSAAACRFPGGLIMTADELKASKEDIAQYHGQSFT